MTIELTTQNIITAASLLTAVTLLVKFFAKGVRQYDKNEKQSADIEQLKQKHDDDIEALKEEFAKNMRAVKEEQQMLNYGVLACLKGLQEKGCNGPVSEAIDKIEKYLNQKAHEG